jgi:hypothetical protein
MRELSEEIWAECPRPWGFRTVSFDFLIFTSNFLLCCGFRARAAGLQTAKAQRTRRVMLELVGPCQLRLRDPSCADELWTRQAMMSGIATQRDRGRRLVELPARGLVTA